MAPERSKRESFSSGRDFAFLVLADAQSAIIRTHRSRNRELENNSFPTLYVSQYLLLLETNTFRNVKKIKVEENGSQKYAHSFSQLLLRAREFCVRATRAGRGERGVLK